MAKGSFVARVSNIDVTNIEPTFITFYFLICSDCHLDKIDQSERKSFIFNKWNKCQVIPVIIVSISLLPFYQSLVQKGDSMN